MDVNDKLRCGLHIAVRKGNMEMLRLLLSHKGVNVNQVDAENQTAIFEAIERKDYDMTLLLH